jgi:hypothetical protein
MAEAQKRFSWWLVVAAVLPVFFAAVVGFIETVGRQGTIVARFHRLELNMAEGEARAILGRREDMNIPSIGHNPGWSIWREGPMDLTIYWIQGPRERHIRSIEFDLSRRAPFLFWRLRRWAEQAYTAIHGPRR